MYKGVEFRALHWYTIHQIKISKFEKKVKQEVRGK